jgi:hypothetical protein
LTSFSTNPTPAAIESVTEHDEIIRNHLRESNLSINELISVHPLWPSKSCSAYDYSTTPIVCPLSPNHSHQSSALDTLSKESNDIIKLISMYLLIEYYSVNGDEGSDHLGTKIQISSTQSNEPSHTRVKYLKDTSDACRPAVVHIYYNSPCTISEPTDAIDSNHDDAMTNPPRVDTNDTKKRNPGRSKGATKASSSANNEPRKSYREIKEPKDAYSRTLAEESKRKTTKRAYSRKSGQVQKDDTVATNNAHGSRKRAKETIIEIDNDSSSDDERPLLSPVLWHPRNKKSAYNPLPPTNTSPPVTDLANPKSNSSTSEPTPSLSEKDLQIKLLEQRLSLTEKFKSDTEAVKETHESLIGKWLTVGVELGSKIISQDQQSKPNPNQNQSSVVLIASPLPIQAPLQTVESSTNKVPSRIVF